MRSLSVLEVATGVSLVGCILAAGIPAFVRNLHASRLVEPVDGITRIATRATALAAAEPTQSAYPASVPQTPQQIPRGVPVLDPPGTWDHPTWRLLDFSFTTAHSYSFTFESNNEPDHATFRAVAHGDLDGDGLSSTFEISGESKEGTGPIVHPLESRREVE